MIKKIVSILVVIVFCYAGLTAEEKKDKKLYLTGGYNFGSKTSESGSALTFKLYDEDGSSSLNYKFKNKSGFDMGLGYRVAGGFAVEAGLALFSPELEAGYSAKVPHPYEYKKVRTASGKMGDMSSSAKAVTLNGVYAVVNSDKFELNLIAGVSFFSAEMSMVEGLSFDEEYPYDTVKVSASKKKYKENFVGFNGGMRVHYKFSRSIDLYVKGIYSSGKKEFRTAKGATTEFDFGGFRAGAGVRIFIM